MKFGVPSMTFYGQQQSADASEQSREAFKNGLRYMSTSYFMKQAKAAGLTGLTLRSLVAGHVVATTGTVAVGSSLIGGCDTLNNDLPLLDPVIDRLDAGREKNAILDYLGRTIFRYDVASFQSFAQYLRSGIAENPIFPNARILSANVLLYANGENGQSPIALTGLRIRNGVILNPDGTTLTQATLDLHENNVAFAVYEKNGLRIPISLAGLTTSAIDVQSIGNIYDLPLPDDFEPAPDDVLESFEFPEGFDVGSIVSYSIDDRVVTRENKKTGNIGEYKIVMVTDTDGTVHTFYIKVGDVKPVLELEQLDDGQEGEQLNGEKRYQLTEHTERYVSALAAALHKSGGVDHSGGTVDGTQAKENLKVHDAYTAAHAAILATLRG